MSIDFLELPAVKVAFLRHEGPVDNEKMNALWQRLLGAFAQEGVNALQRRMYGIYWIDRDSSTTAPLRYDACVQIDPLFFPGMDIEVQQLCGGRYACREFLGTASGLSEAWKELFSDLPRCPAFARDGERPALEAFSPALVYRPKDRVIKCLLCVPAS